MENTKAKNVIIVILVLLLAVIIGFVGFYMYKNLDMNKNEEEYTATINSLNEQITAKNTEISEKEAEITKLKEENDTLTKKSQTVVTKNTFVKFNSSKVTSKDNYKSWTLGDTQVRVEGGYMYYEITSKGGVVGTFVYDYDSDFETQFVNNKKYTISGLTKKVVELYPANEGQTALQSCIAIMEDGTIAQIFAINGKITTKVIKGISNVVRIISIFPVNGKSGIYTAAVQGNGKIVTLRGQTGYEY